MSEEGWDKGLSCSSASGLWLLPDGLVWTRQEWVGAVFAFSVFPQHLFFFTLCQSGTSRGLRSAVVSSNFYKRHWNLKAKRPCANIGLYLFFFNCWMRYEHNFYVVSAYVCGKHSSVQISGYLIGVCIVWECVLTPSILPCVHLIWILPCLGGNPISVVDGAVNENSVVPFAFIRLNCSFSHFPLLQIDIWLY